jgi:hypothetical protein
MGEKRKEIIKESRREIYSYYEVYRTEIIKV